MTILVLEGLHGQTRHLVAVNSSTQQINYDPCLNVKIFNQTRPPNPFFTTCPGMTKFKTLISKTFVLLWTVIYDIKFIQFRIRGISAIIELVDHFCNSILPASYSQGLPGRLQYCIVQFTGASRAKLTLFLWSKY